MSADVQSMIYMGEKPWHGLGLRLDTSPSTSAEIIQKSGLDWTTAVTPHYTFIGDKQVAVKNFHSMYREDIFKATSDIEQATIGNIDISSDKIKMVQNVDTFGAIESLLGSQVEVETAASLGRGQKVFGCFKIGDYKLIDDAIDQYIVIYNDHLKPDGKVTVLNTPIRVVCQNTLSAALSGTLMKYRIACSNDTTKNQSIASFIQNTMLASQSAMNKAAERMLDQKITKEYVEKLLDELFPYIKADTGSTHDRANEAMAYKRETFLTKCMDVDNLQNYKGTQYQIFNALADYSQHWYSSSTSGVDLEARMQNMPGMVADPLMSKYQKIATKLIA